MHRPKDQARYCCVSLEQPPGTLLLSDGRVVRSLNLSKICVLDEPSNFLDREALGGLAVAIRDWAGAVVSALAVMFDCSV